MTRSDSDTAGDYPRHWSVPSPYGAPKALDALSGVAAPLLAGFSISLSGALVVSAERFRFPGMALLLLSLATVLLLFCVQSGFWARHYFASPDEATQWWDDYASSRARQGVVRRQQRQAYRTYRIWARWTRKSYSLSIVLLLGGVAVALVPNGDSAQANLQRTASLVFAGAAIGELTWIAAASRWIPSRQPRSLESEVPSDRA